MKVVGQELKLTFLHNFEQFFTVMQLQKSDTSQQVHIKSSVNPSSLVSLNNPYFKSSRIVVYSLHFKILI